jgi:hypothetical protein
MEAAANVQPPCWLCFDVCKKLFVVLWLTIWCGCGTTLLCMCCRPCFEQVVQQLEDMASHLDELKQQQAQAMAAAAAPLFHPAQGGHHDSDPGHELTLSMMAELMPSGFGPGSGPSDIEEEDQCSGVLYEMSQLSDQGGGSQECAGHLDLGSDDADAAVVEGFEAGVERPGVFAAPSLCSGEAVVGALVGSRSLSSGSKHGSRVAVVQ